MKVTADALPNDIEALKALVLAQASERAKQAQEIDRQRAKIITLEEQLNLLLHKRFGRTSEKVSPDQLRLFNEAEAALQDDEPAAVEAASEEITVQAHTRKRGGRKPLPAHLPRVEVIHALAESDRVCPHDGERLTEIGEEISEQLDIVPAKVQVIRHIRKKYACPCCEQGVRTAALPPQPIPKSLASPGLLAHVAVAKYVDALPLYRQERILNRIGVELPRATLANWMIRSGELIVPLINLMRETMLDGELIQMDETTVQVLKEDGKAATSKSYLWVQRGGPPAHPLILYEYDPSRGQSVPLRLLEGFTGYLQTDGYDGYNAVGNRDGITHLGCWAHARRKFDEAVKAQGHRGQAKAGKAMMGLAWIQKLYRIEKAAKAATPQQRYQLRQQQAKPIVDELRAWLDRTLAQVPPSTLTGKALHYLHNQWDRLVRYLEDGRLPIDNNLTENAIRPFVLGRKNWLFSDTVKGANASANLYSLIETAKANGLEPYQYLRHVFTQLPQAQTVEQIEVLLPYHIDPKTLSVN